MTNNNYISGAKKIIEQCLRLQKDQSLVIVIDETTIDVGIVLAEAADALKVPQTSVFIPISLQRKIPKLCDLSLSTQELARSARAIITCINSDPLNLSFREHLLYSNWSARTRIGHMPGASLEILDMANVDFNKLISDCHNIEVAMARGQEIDLVSTSSEGEQHHLKADIGSWDRLPVASDGVIEDGVWGNVPSGETYIAPIEGTGEGSVVINGSIPNLVIQPDQEIILFFKEGELVRIVPSNNLSARWLQQTQIDRAIEKNDSLWSNLAEIGIGANPAVKKLSGNMLFDEKCYGTAHVAIGNNSIMGGNIKASIHCDMVIRSPKVIVDGKKIVDLGVICYDEADWHENYDKVTLKGSLAHKMQKVSRSGTQTDTYGRRLQRLLRSEPGRVSACFVGDEDTSRIAYDVYKRLSPDGDWITIKDLSRNSELDEKITRKILHIMRNYSLVRFQE